MTAINSYSQIPSPLSRLVDGNGIIDNIWHLFFSKLAAGIYPIVYNAPVTGFAFTVPPGVKNVQLNPAGVLANGTLIMPPSATDGQEIMFNTSQTITTATFSPNAGQAIVNAPATLVAGSSVSFIFSQQVGTWFKK